MDISPTALISCAVGVGGAFCSALGYALFVGSKVGSLTQTVSDQGDDIERIDTYGKECAAELRTESKELQGRITPLEASVAALVATDRHRDAQIERILNAVERIEIVVRTLPPR